MDGPLRRGCGARARTGALAAFAASAKWAGEGRAGTRLTLAVSRRRWHFSLAAVHGHPKGQAVQTVRRRRRRVRHSATSKGQHSPPTQRPSRGQFGRVRLNTIRNRLNPIRVRPV